MCAQVTIPNRPLGTDQRSIEAILANFDAVTAQINGNLDSTNIAASLAKSSGVNQPGEIVKGYSHNSVSDSITDFGYVLAAHPDQVSAVVVPANGLLEVTAWIQAGKTAGGMGLGLWVTLWVGPNHVGGSQVQAWGGPGGPLGQYCEVDAFTGYAPTVEGIIATQEGSGTGINLVTADGSSHPPVYQGGANPQFLATPIRIAVPAGTYDVALQYKIDGGVSAFVADRVLAVRSLSFS